MPRTFSTRLALVAALVSFGIPTPSRADYPDKPVRLIAPFPPGGGVDSVARVIANALSERLGRQFIVDNHGGASGRIGTELAAKATPDGYTLLLGSVGPNAIVPAAYRNLPYDAVNSFAPISLVGTSAYALVVSTAVAAKTVDELIALAKAQPGKLNFASTGNLGGPHLAGELFKDLAKIKAEHIAYKGGGPIIAALLGNEVSFAFVSLPTVAPHMKAGTLRVLAVTGSERATTMRNVPTMAESLPGYQVLQWYGVLSPANTPVEIVGRLHDEIVKAVNDPKIKARLASIDTEAYTNTPEAFQAQIKADIAKYRKLIEQAGVQVE